MSRFLCVGRIKDSESLLYLELETQRIGPAKPPEGLGCTCTHSVSEKELHSISGGAGAGKLAVTVEIGL